SLIVCKTPPILSDIFYVPAQALGRPGFRRYHSAAPRPSPGPRPARDRTPHRPDAPYTPILSHQLLGPPHGRASRTFQDRQTWAKERDEYLGSDPESAAQSRHLAFACTRLGT